MKFDLKKTFINSSNQLSKAISKNAPEILAGAGIACWIATVFTAVKATPKAVKLLEEKKKELNTEELTIKDTVLTAGKEYVPSALTGVAGTCFIIASVNTSNRRYIALSTSYELTREAARLYRDKVIETVGEKKEKQIRSAVAEQEVKDNPPTPNINIYQPKDDGQYKTLFFEPITKRYFWDTRANVILAIQKAYQEMKNSFENNMSAYTFLTFLPDELMNGFPDGFADKYMDIGWSMNDPYDVLVIDIVNGGTICGGEYDGYPCLKLEYSEMPSYNFRSAY